MATIHKILVAGAIVLGSSLSAATYTMTSDGDVTDSANWDGGLDFASLQTGDVLNVNNLNATLVSGDKNFNGAILNVTGSGDLTNNGNKNITNVTVNIQGDATMSGDPNGNYKVVEDAVFNYNSTATSSVDRFSLFRESAALNISNGLLEVGMDGLNLNRLTILTGNVNLTGGDLSFGAYDWNANGSGFINFDSSAGSVLTFAGNAQGVDALDAFITNGRMTIDGQAVDLSDFDRSFSSGNLVVSVASVAVPEPSTSALIGLGGMALLLRRRK